MAGRISRRLLLKYGTAMGGVAFVKKALPIASVPAQANSLSSSRNLRMEEELPAPWRFQIDQDNLGEREKWYVKDFDRSGWARVKVPQAWDLYEKALWGYERVGWYAAEIPVEKIRKGRWQKLPFTGVNTQARVWLNGVYLGEHTGGYLPFEFSITPHLESDKTNHLVLRVDGRSFPIGDVQASCPAGERTRAKSSLNTLARMFGGKSVG